MIDPSAETLIPFVAARQVFPGRHGRGVSLSTLHRWKRHGVRGVRLETVLVGGVRYTSREALNRFVSKTTRLGEGGGLDA